MKHRRSISTALLVSALLLALSACQKHEGEGPAEHAGKAIDKVVEKAGQQVEKAGEAIQETAKGDKQ
ncbi:hypothetical protein [Candidatus Accumulibacter sp. ACC003]|uniref:hypothetical protein n=1 Tax=Candidatus Accumulibacter sp. ACC003 TaxID=2823334 RepID=UPI0025BB05D2|nr:hypothetical protein [Candidatus Accumulibacter sp. ACC003]